VDDMTMMDQRPSSGPSSPLDPAEEGITADPSSAPSSRTTSGPMLNGRGADWFPQSTDDIDSALADASAFCRHKCPMFSACIEDACHVFRIEKRADDARRAGLASRVGVLDEPTIGIA
jgi:hypothetical protein